MDSTIQKKIQNFVRKFLIRMLLEDKFKNHNNISNVMITAYFNHNMRNIKSTDNIERRKFFYAFRKKYIEDFQRNRKLFTTLISNFKRRKAFIEFKSRLTASEWERINGDKMSKYLALKDRMVSKEDFEDLYNIIKIIDK